MIRNPMPILLGVDAPRVMTVPMLAAALSSGRSLPARGTLFNWLRAQRENGVLRQVTRGLYLNQLAQPAPQAAEAASYVRSEAVVSLQLVVGEAGISNNYLATWLARKWAFDLDPEVVANATLDG